VEDTLNQMLDAEAEALVGAARYERNAERADYRSGSYSRKLSAQEKARAVSAKLTDMRLGSAAEMLDRSVEETLSYYDFPPEHWRRIRTNNPLERIIREIRRRTQVVGAFPDGNSALMLCAARLRHIAGTRWGSRKCLNMELLRELDKERENQAACRTRSRPTGNRSRSIRSYIFRYLQ
jgi:transposase-like protein